MSDLSQPANALSGDEALARLAAVWGTPGGSREDLRAEAWARRALKVEAAPGDAELVAEVDAGLLVKHGLRRAS